MFGKAIIRGAIAIALIHCTAVAQADVFRMNTGLTSLEMVPVGNPGNDGELSGYGGGYAFGAIVGGVPYAYQIGKFEVTAAQYTEFLNKVAATDTYGLYHEYMDYDLHPTWFGCNIKRSGASGSYTYSVAPDWANRPVSYVSWGDAARFANWLHNGQPTGAQGSLTTEDGSYYLNGATNNATLMTATRKPGATWVIPNSHEWYKAAYYDPNKDGVGVPGYWDYAMMSDEPTVPSNDLTTPDGGNNAAFFIWNGYSDCPVGMPYYRAEVGDFENSASAYGTFDQGGNVDEWNETVVVDGLMCGTCGGNWREYSHLLRASYRNGAEPIYEAETQGFRMAYVPEPSTLALFGLSIISLLGHARRKGR
jgi:formylglycine-generating enzyme